MSFGKVKGLEASARIGARLRDSIRGSEFYAPIRRQRLRRLTERPGAYPDWSELLGPINEDWRAALGARKNKRVLIATSLGLHFTANAIDSLLAVALTLRGAEVEFLLCDGVLPACQVVDHTLAPNINRYARRGPQPDFCEVCSSAGISNLERLGLPIHRYSEFVSVEEIGSSLAEARELALANLNPDGADPVMEHGHAGALRFFGRSRLPSDEVTMAVAARYMAAARLARKGAARLLERGAFDAVVAHHGIYVPQGLVADAAKAAGISLVTWHPSYRRGRLIYEHADTYHRSMISEPSEYWADRAMDDTQERMLEDYLISREGGDQDWITFQRSEPQSKGELEKELRISFRKPTMIMIGNVAWDARLHYKSSAYGDMATWAQDTVRWFAANPEQQLIVRCHPGEVMSSPKAQDRLDDIVRAVLPTDAPNIAVIPPESALNTYALARQCKTALIYNTKMGMELAARGMPVVVAGDAWIRGKGFSQDADDPASYFSILEQAHQLPSLDERRLALARRYAYHFFFRRCIPVSAIDPEAGWPLCALSARAAELARPGVDSGLEVICKGILEGAPFAYEGPGE